MTSANFEAETRLPAVPPPSPRDQLAAAILRHDPSAVVLERSEGATSIRFAEPAAPDAVAVLIDSTGESQAEILQRVATQIRAAVAAHAPRQHLHVVVMGSPGVDFKSTLRSELGPAPLGFLVSKHGHVWSPGAELETVIGLASSTLRRSVKERLSAFPDVAGVVADRAEQQREANEFLAELKTRRPVMTWALATTSIAVFGLQLLWGAGEPIAPAARMGAGSKSLVFHGETWRLLSATVLHANFVHLLLNMLALLSFGTFLEQVLGRRRYLLLYVLSGLGGSLLGMLRTSQVISVGASGGIWGLMVAGAVLVTRPRGRLPALVAAAKRQRAWGPVALNAFYSFSPGIDWLAHLGGGLTGGLLLWSGWIFVSRPAARGEATDSRGIRVFAAIAGIALAVSIGAAWVTGRPWDLRRRPQLARIDVADAAMSIELPPLLTPPQSDKAEYTWVFGGLQYDPVAFVVVLPPSRLVEEEFVNPEKTLESIADAVGKGESPPEGFKPTAPFKVEHHEGVPCLHGRHESPDGRSVDSFYMITGRHLSKVMVLSTKGASPEWNEVAARVPFSLVRRD